jgi:hypothetical protein
MTSTQMATLQRRRLVDEAMDAYLDWREECFAVSDAYRGWAGAETTDAGLAFGVYTAALDREERASQVYAGLIRRVGDLVTADGAPETDLTASGAGPG